MSSKLLISVDESCAAADIGRTFANQSIRENRVASIRLGGRRLVVLSSLQKLIEEFLAQQAR